MSGSWVVGAPLGVLKAYIAQEDRPAARFTPDQRPGHSHGTQSAGDSLQPVAGPARRTGRASPVLQEVVVARLRALVGAILVAALVLAFA